MTSGPALTTKRPGGPGRLTWTPERDEPTRELHDRRPPTSPERFGFDDVDELRARAGLGPGDAPVDAVALLGWAHERFEDALVIAHSMGPEDVVILDLLASIGLADRARVFTLDTGRLPQQTYELMEALRTRYATDFEVYFPETQAVEELVRAKGPHSFYASVEARRECCHIRKVEPLGRVLGTASAWVTGLRREQSPTRAQSQALELDLANGGLIKLNPLIEWTHAQVWEHIRAHDLPYNALHDQGYASIGCAPCTRAIEPGEDERAGRWWWERPDQKECGLHPATADDDAPTSEDTSP